MAFCEVSNEDIEIKPKRKLSSNKRETHKEKLPWEVSLTKT